MAIERPKKQARDDARILSEVVANIQEGVEVETNFRTLFYRCRRLLSFFFYRQGLQADLRDDLVQETMLNVFRSIQKFRGEAHFDTWLFGIAGNVARAHVRKLHTAKRDARVISLDDFPDTQGGASLNALAGAEPTPLDAALNQEEKIALRLAVDDLPRQMRQCAILRYQSDLKYAEIASILGISLNSVRVQLWRARRRLQQSLARTPRAPTSGREPARKNLFEAPNTMTD